MTMLDKLYGQNYIANYGPDFKMLYCTFDTTASFSIDRFRARLQSSFAFNQNLSDPHNKAYIESYGQVSFV